MAPATPSRSKTATRYGLALLLVAGGVAHLIDPARFVAIMPPLRYPLALVYLSGIAELAIGLGLLHPTTRRWAALGAMALLVTVFPANVYQAVSEIDMSGLDAPWKRWLRLPMQLPLIAAAWWVRD